MTTVIDTKRCSRCGEVKLPVEFWKNLNRPDGLQDYCKTCLSEYNAARRRDRPSEPYLVDVKVRYGLTPLDIRLIERVQGGVCGACGGPFKGNGLTGYAVDHDHATGWVRGFLCQGCNTSLEDGKEPAPRFVEYLADPPARRAGVWRKVRS